MMEKNDGTIKLRPIYSSTYSPQETVESISKKSTRVADSGVQTIEVANISDEDDEKGHDEPILLPQSTHTLLFTEPILSIPFIFAVIIAIMSAMCLILALLNNATNGLPGNLFSIPVNVGPAVRGAQYISVVVALLMEEEIPTALFLLRNITPESFRQKFPKMKYGMFVISSTLRLVLGYTFLINVMLVVIQADSVLDIFYDMLALQFVQQLDDIAFNLAKMEVLGQHLEEATTKKCFRSEFKRKNLVRFQKTNLFLKAIYVFNLFISLGGVLYVTLLQRSGHFQCSEITVKFGDDIWEKAIVKEADGSLKQMVLVYSFFNGVYVTSSDHTSDGRPVYVEQRKRDRTPYNQSKIVPAQIKYCKKEQAWIFTHENIKKSYSSDDSGCSSWLLRSPDTLSYNLLEVSGYWSVWKGVIEYSEFLAVCNECSDDTECNLNGACTNGKCICDPKSQHVGTHCEHQLPCRKLEGYNNDTWSLHELTGNQGDFFSVHDRPVYIYSSGLGNLVDDADQLALVYTGSRWFGALYEGLKNVPLEYWVEYSADYHSFWDKIYDNNTVTVSDATTDTSPIGVDFYIIRDRGEQYGPYGLLEPLRLPSGSGYFRCGDGIKDSEKMPRFMVSDRMLSFQNSNW